MTDPLPDEPPDPPRTEVRGSVSGRSYRHARPKGSRPWQPTGPSQALLDAVRDVLATYAEQLPLTQRQAYYVLIGRGQLTKGQQGEDKLKRVLDRARRADMLPYEAFRQDRTQQAEPPGYTSALAWWVATAADAADFELVGSLGQPVAVELWCEARGMVPQLARVAEPYGVAVFGLSGDPPLGFKREAAERIGRRTEPTTVLYVGDWDPSGLSIIDSVAAEVGAFLAERWPDAEVRWERIAVTPEQIVELDLEPKEGNKADRKGGAMDQVVQAEAMPPDQLADQVDAELAAHTDTEVRDRVAARSKVLRRQQLAAVLDASGEHRADVVQALRNADLLPDDQADA